jgi:hypothetical protein
LENNTNVTNYSINEYINKLTSNKQVENDDNEEDNKEPEKCLGCRYDCPSQLDHMDCDGGCLHIEQNCYKCSYN